MTRKPEIHAVFEHCNTLEGGYPTTHRLTTALGLKRVMNKVALKELDHALRLTFICREDAEALGLREEANGEFPGFIELLFGSDRTDCER